MSWKNYIGCLAIANPNNPIDGNERTVILIVNHDKNGAVGLRINKILPETNLISIAHHLGIEYYKNTEVHESGDRNTNKIHIIHSLDWRGIGTVALNKEIGITHDISVLVALSQNDGPEYFKACAGYGVWAAGILEEQLSSTIIHDDPYKFEIIPATIENVFQIDPEVMWDHCIQHSIVNRVKDYF